MKRLAFATLVALSGSIAIGAELPRSSPEAQGVSSQAVLAFVEAADRAIAPMNSFMLLRHGHVVAEGWWSPYDAGSPHSLYSLSKSFTATAVGIAIAEGKLRLDDEVLKFFPEEAPADPSNNLKAMRVSDLLRMSTGHQTEPPRPPDQPWTKAFLAHPVPFKPGTHFLYNTSATYMLSAVVQKATGMTVLDYLKPRLFEPLGIEHPTWEASPQGVTTGGYGLSVRTEDVARFGQLYLRKGKWQGEQLVPEAWVGEATARQTSNGSNPDSDWDQGYGYQFWRCRHAAYRGDGAFGQFCVVLPEQDAVVVITSGVRDMQAVLDLVWDRLLPALKTTPLDPDDASRTKLERALKGLSLRPQDGSGSPAEVSGKTYVFAPNGRKLEAVALESGGPDGAATLVARIDGKERRIPCGRGAWHKGRMAWGRLPEQPAAASGAWTGEGTFTARLCFTETPFLVTVRLKFSGEEVRCESEANVGFGPAREPPLVGTTSANRRPPESPARTTAAPQGFARWEKEVAAYEASDRAGPPPRGGALFIGSSTIRRWDSLGDDFPGHRVINRGFGGSEIADATHFADRIIFPYEPKQIFLRAGGNDIHAGKLPEQVAADFAEFVRTVRGKLPEAEILYIAVNPAPARWGEKDKYRALNQRIRELALHLPRVGFVDCYDISLTDTGRARPELFVADKLHFNAEGYRVLADRVRPYLTTAK
jgi:CubicO group peptidase (beta-lactamase class C family)/lysophospholipase L1-like esterase